MVVGRVLEVGNRVWHVDIRARQQAQLRLSAVHLPGGVQVWGTGTQCTRCEFAGCDLTRA